ncbi:S1 RNA-binding domain-containing protein [Streptosporangium subroseum]|uniref:S1 RNA-binding domain-containing protein n=1 Tax=Streptosporangium subroseum TaxID=106412 RepID=UPI00341F5E92
MTYPELSEHERDLITNLVEGRVEAVFRWGVIVDLGLSRVGLIDALYIDDHDNYSVGDTVAAYLDAFDEQKQKFILRPPDQEPLSERLKRKGFDV